MWTYTKRSPNNSTADLAREICADIRAGDRISTSHRGIGNACIAQDNKKSIGQRGVEKRIVEFRDWLTNSRVTAGNKAASAK
jgi:hypothetical protein